MSVLSRWLKQQGKIKGRRQEGAERRRAAKRRVVLRAVPTLEELEERVVPSLLGQQLFPSDYPWNQNISSAPVAANSAAIISHIGASIGIHPDWGEDSSANGNSPLYGIPFNVVHGNSPTVTKVNVIIDNYPGESDIVAVPMPANPVIEGDYQNGPNMNGPGYGQNQRGDSHLIIWDEDNNIAYEFYEASRPNDPETFNGAPTGGNWHAAQETVWNMNTDTFRSLGYTSADAAGLSILAGLARPDEGLPVSQGGQGAIDHALRFTLPGGDVNPQYIYPASHQVDDSQSSVSLPFGARLRLENTPAVNAIISTLGPEAQIIAHAMQQYGLVLADIGSSMYVTGTSAAEDANNNISLTWNMDDVLGLNALTAGDFQVVNLTPVVTSLSASSGLPGDTVTVVGQNFSGAAGHLSVFFGNTLASSINYVDDSHITAVVPSGTGTVNVTVQSGVNEVDDYSDNTNANVNAPIFGYGTSATSSSDQFTYNVSTTPAVLAVAPAAGPLSGGGTVTITGTNFTGCTLVDFGTVAASSFTVVSSTQITAVAPTQAAGTDDVTVTTPHGTTSTSSADRFAYVALPVVSTIAPTSGPAAGGTSVTITGTNLANASAVDFGTIAVTTFSSDTAGQIVLHSPAGAGVVDVTVTTAGGTSTTSAADKFTFIAAPVVTGVSPASGPPAGNTSVTITGSNMGNATAVKFGTALGAIVSDTATQIVATDPADTGTVNVTVVTAGGTSSTSAADRFTYAALVAPVLPAVTPNPYTVNFGQSATINLNASDPNGYSLSFTASLLDPLLAIKTTYGLTLQDGYFNERGRSEKYLLSTNGSNAAGGGWYVLMPTGSLYAWNGSIASTLASIPVAATAPSVWYNPSLLTANTGAPIVTAGTNPLYDLKIQLGLVTPSNPAYNDERGDDEEYLQSTNGSNAAGGGWYVLMPDDKLYAWNGSIAADQLVADLNPYGNVYAIPALLTNASLPTALGVTATTNTAGGGSLTLTPAAGFDRAVGVTVTANDGHMSASKSFTLQVNDTAPSVQAVDPITVSHGGSQSTINLAASGNGTLTYSVSVTGYNPLYDLQQQLGLNQADLTQSFNGRGQNEKYFQSTNGSNAANGGYYVLMPTDKLYAWNGVSLASTVAAGLVADFTQAPYAGLGNVYNDPALLYKTAMPAGPTVASNRGTLYDIQTEFGLSTPDLTQSFNARGQNEKYLLSANGSNLINGGYYILMPTDKLYAWDGDSLATTLANAPVADFTADGPVYAEPSLLYAAQLAFVNDPLFNLKQQLGLTSADIALAFNARGQNEKYLHSTDGSNSANGGYYVLMPTDKLYAWDGVSLATTIAKTPVADFTQAPYSAFLGSGNVYGTPSLLYASTGQTAAVAAVVSSSGVITLTPSSAFAGTVRITATVSDGAEMTKQSFLFTVNDSVPALQPISPLTASSSAGSTTVNFTATTFNGAAFQPAAAIAGYNPLFSLKSLDGLNQADMTQYFNSRGQNEKYFRSTNGSNPAGGGWYILMPTDKLYAWDGVSLATTLANGLVADFTQPPYAGLGNVYNNTALLYNATQPSAPIITATFPNPGSLKLAWSTGYTGTFQLTLTIGDGALETTQSFLVTVS